jgi:hypothetical protein
MEDRSNLISTLAKAKNNVQNMLSSLRKLERMSESPTFNLHKIKSEIKKIDKKLLDEYLLESIREEIAAANEEYRGHLEEWEAQTKKEFGEKLEGVLSEAGYTLRGDYTRLMVSLFTLELDLDKMRVIIWYGNKQESVISGRMNLDDVVKKLDIAHKRIMERAFDSGSFLKQLLSAWRAVQSRQGGKSSERVAISDLLQEFVYQMQPRKFYTNPSKANFTGYERAHFSYDLFRLEEREIDGLELNLVTATRAFTRTKSGFLWVPADLSGNGDFISHIIFREE